MKSNILYKNSKIKAKNNNTNNININFKTSGSESKTKSKNSQLNILSWNIQASNTVTGNKFEDPSFLNLLTPYDILCLQEVRQRVKIEGFRSLCNIRLYDLTRGQAVLPYCLKMNS
ncbi:MAG: hypothetical protein HRU38_24960 [Saccharospirillaceae bacterium]|nr:hypothetical protein [Saccharospirillaceae bacterium]